VEFAPQYRVGLFFRYFGGPRRDRDRGVIVSVTPDAFFRMDAGFARRYRRCPMTMSDRKRAESYLAASGAVPICVTRRDGVCTIHAGRAGAHGADVVSTQWIDQRQAIAVTREARRYAGDRPDGPTAADALARAAASQRTTLTADHVAIERAGAAAAKVEQHLAALRKTGGLREFNREFAARRNEARAAGHGFMSYSAATARLRSAMVERLVGRDTIGPVGQLFEKIFGIVSV
jgi:hypothetical protein